jgi:hypothetical protein
MVNAHQKFENFSHPRRAIKEMESANPFIGSVRNGYLWTGFGPITHYPVQNHLNRCQGPIFAPLDPK